MKTTRRVMSVVLAIAMVLTTFGMVTVSAASYSDTTGHWAESYINVWSDYGVIQGDGGYFRPDDAITRAEVAQVTQNVISYEDAANNGFSDVPAGAWYEDAILKLAAAGTLTGNGDGTMSPDNYMTREEAMTMLARAYGLTVENSQAGITQYADYQTVSDYATGYVGAMTAAGYVSGYEDGTIRPQANISRAEFVKILDNMIKLYITAPGTYGPGYYGGIAMVKVGGVTLNGVVGNGAVISPQVSGEVALQNCQFTGNTVNLSKNASVTSNTGVNTSSQTSVPNTYYGSGPYSGSIGGSIGGGSVGSVTVTFYYYDDFSVYKRVSVTKGGKLNSSKVPNPTAEGDDNWNGAWYKSQEAAEKGMGTEFDPTRQAVTANTVLYAGRAGKVPEPTIRPIPTIDPNAPTATPKPTAKPTAIPNPTTKPGEPTEAPTTAPQNAISWNITDMFVKADGSLDTTRFPESSHKDNEGNVDRFNVTSTSIVNVNGLSFITASEINESIQKSEKTFDDGFKSTWSLKTGGEGSDTDKVFVFTPNKAGTLKIYATSGSSGKTLPITVKQDGQTIGSVEVTSGVFEVKTVEGLEAGKEVRIVAGGNIQYYNLVFVEDGSADPDATPTALPTPGKYSVSVGDINGNGTVELFTNIDKPAGSEKYEYKVSGTTLEAGQELGLENVISVSPLYTTSVGTGKGKEIDGVNYPDRVVIRLKNAPGDTMEQYDAGTTSLKVVPAVDGKITIACRGKDNTATDGGMRPGKVLQMSLKNADGTYTEWAEPVCKTTGSEGNFANGTISFDLTAGSEYIIWTNSALPLYGFNYSYGEAQEPQGVQNIDDLEAGTKVYVKAVPGAADDAVKLGTDANVELTPVTGRDGYYSFEMPAKDVKVLAAFGETELPAPTPIVGKDAYKATLNVTNGTGVLEGEGLVSAQSDEYVETISLAVGEDVIDKTIDGDNTVYSFVGSGLTFNTSFGNDELYLFNNGGVDVKIDDNALVKTSSVMTDDESTLQGVIKLVMPFTGKICANAGTSSSLSSETDVYAQIGLGENNSTKKAIVTVPSGVKNSTSYTDSTEEQFFSANAGDAVYFYCPTAATIKYCRFTIIPSASESTSAKWVAIDHQSEYEGSANPEPVKIGDAITMSFIEDTYSINTDAAPGLDPINGVQGANNVSVNDNDIPVSGSAFKFASTEDGKLKLRIWFYGVKDGSAYKVVECESGASTGNVIVNVPGDGTQNFYDSEFDVKAGYDYYAYVLTTRIAVSTVEFVSATSEPEATPTSIPDTTPTEEPLPDNVYKFVEGSTVTVKTQPDADKSNYVAEITVTGADGKKINVTDNTFVMPSQDVTVDVVYKEPTDNPIQTQEPTVILPEAKTVLYVDGSKDTDAANNQFKTVREAVAKAAEINPQSNEDRVEIQIMPGLYREQIVLKTPYVTFRKAEAATEKEIQATWGETSSNKTGTYQPDSTKEVVLTWYYGIGSSYKSIGSDGFYDPNANNADPVACSEKWGATVYATSAAKEFVAYDIVFENSYNRYVTDEEIADGVTPNDGKSARTKDSDVAANTYNERSAALYTDSDKAQFLNCKMLSSQDTFGANSRLYVKDCYIEGRTDYICGKASAIFDNCQLMFYGYSNSDNSGTITAMQEPVVPGYGVLFNECYIGNTKSSTANGSLGRPWRQSAQVTYYNCIFEKNTSLISASGWGGMGEATVEGASFGEYGSKYTDGTPVDLSGRTAKSITVKDDWSILEYNGRNYLNNGDGWDPMGVADLYANVDKVLSETTVAIPEGTSTKVDLPAAPNGYEFKWESNSEYATVNNDGTLTVVRPANGEAPIETTIVLYTREADNKTIGDKKIIPVTIAPTTDTENVFTMSGTVSLTKAADKNVDVVIKAYQGTAVIKTQNVTIEAGQKSAQYTAGNIPVGSYDVLADCVTQGYRVLTPDSGKATVSGVKGGTNTLDVTVAKLVEVKKDVTTDPTTIGSGVTVTNNSGSYHVASTTGVTGGAYWNLVDLAAELETTETVTLSYRLTISDVFTNKDGANGASIDLLTNTPGIFASSENKARVIRTLFGRWDQVNMLDAKQASISGSSNSEHMWLNCSGDKFDSKATFPISYDLSITVDFKNNSISATAQTVGENKKVYEYEFEGFPTEINRDKLSLAFYTGSKAKAEYDVSNISVTYTKFE